MSIRFMPVYKKELGSFLKSPSLYVVAGLFFLLLSLFFQDILIFFSQMSMNAGNRPMGSRELNLTLFVVQNTFSVMNFLFLFVVPILTMRLFSEEKKSGTFELLVTYPFKDWDILLGKFFAAATIIFAILVISLSYPLVLVVLGEPEIPVIISAYAGVLLMCLAYAAYGLFASAITENQIVAAIVTFAGLLLFYLIGDLAAARAGFLVSVFDQLSMRVHVSNFIRGLIETVDIAYFILFIGFFLFLTARVLESRRWRV